MPKQNVKITPGIGGLPIRSAEQAHDGIDATDIVKVDLMERAGKRVNKGKTLIPGAADAVIDVIHVEGEKGGKAKHVRLTVIGEERLVKRNTWQQGTRHEEPLTDYPTNSKELLRLIGESLKDHVLTPAEAKQIAEEALRPIPRVQPAEPMLDKTKIARIP